MSDDLILIVDDNAAFTDEISRDLNDMGFSNRSTARSAAEALEAAAELQPALILINPLLPGKIDGIDAAVAIQKSLTVPLIYITDAADPVVFRRAIMTNPYGYLIKPLNDGQLLTSIELALHRHRQDICFHKARKTYSDLMNVIDDNPLSAETILTNREMEILALIGSGECNKAIARKLFLSVRTVEFHRYRIMRKLNVKNAADLIKMAIHLGLTPLEISTAVAAPSPK